MSNEKNTRSLVDLSKLDIQLMEGKNARVQAMLAFFEFDHKKVVKLMKAKKKVDAKKSDYLNVVRSSLEKQKANGTLDKYSAKYIRKYVDPSANYGFNTVAYSNKAVGTKKVKEHKPMSKKTKKICIIASCCVLGAAAIGTGTYFLVNYLQNRPEPYTKISLDEATKIAKGYRKIVEQNPNTDINISGKVTNINLKGDFQWWSAEVEDPQSAMGLLSYIPNFSVTDSEINIQNQSFKGIKLPAAITANFSNTNRKMHLISNVVKIPMNEKFVKFFYGIDKLNLKRKEGKPVDSYDWTSAEAYKWDTLHTTFYRVGKNKLAIDCEFDDYVKFDDEFETRVEQYQQEQKEQKFNEGEKYKLPVRLKFVTNEYGYIGSVDLGFDFKGIEEEVDKPNFYLYMNGDATVNLHLDLEHEYAKPLDIKYAIDTYDIDENGKKSITYNRVGPTSSLEQLKQSGYINDIKIVSKYDDDPIFEEDYWRNRNATIAYSGMPYEVNIIGGKKDNKYYQILGNANSFNHQFNDGTSLLSVVKEGRTINKLDGVEADYQAKTLYDAIDLFYGQNEEGYYTDRLYINGSQLVDTGKESNFVVHIPVYVGIN